MSNIASVLLARPNTAHGHVLELYRRIPFDSLKSERFEA